MVVFVVYFSIFGVVMVSLFLVVIKLVVFDI